MNYFLDTNICIYLINQRPIELMEKFKQFEPYEIGISSIVLSELRYGVAKSQNRENNIKRLNAFLMPFKVLSYDYSAAKVYGDIRAALEK